MRARGVAQRNLEAPTAARKADLASITGFLDSFPPGLFLRVETATYCVWRAIYEALVEAASKARIFRILGCPVQAPTGIPPLAAGRD